MDFVKIYLPEELLRATAECRLFGRSQANINSTSFYIASAQADLSNEIKCIGAIGHRPTSQEHAEQHFLDFIPATGNGSILLRAISVHGQPVNSSVKIQLIIFDHSQLLAIAHIDVAPDRRAFDEEFVGLLETIQMAKSNGSHSNAHSERSAAPGKPTLNGSRLNGLKSPFSAIRNTAVFQHLVARQMQFTRLDRYLQII